ncbi:obscurin-like, partial [Frankliniella occidentalis]|uniref:Obscurin-like n=1 Tax=Frankliniella occidentalis TaxID=133901 RepID=A0A9C6XVD4_FRAOC
MLELKVEGSPKPEIAWTKDGQDIKAGGRVRFLYEDDESMSMIIKGVTPEDAGTYTVTAWNDMGEDFAEVTLNVKAPPKFKTKMKDQACMTDDTLRVTVEVEGTPAPELSWYKDGQEISSTDERFHIVKETSETYVLVIEKVRLDDSGSYSVVARNEVSQTSEFYKVAVQSPPFFTQKIAPRKIEVREGDFTTFTVKVDGDPKPRVRWFKDDEELLNDDRHIKIESDRDGETHTLTIRGINRDDMGKYTCELDNRNGRVSDSTTMHVHCVPLVKQKLKDIVSKEGELNIVFEVTIEAFPQPEIKWFQDELCNQHGQSCISKGVEVTERKTLLTRTVDEQHIYLKTYKLTMKEVKVEQAGVYTCKATNTMGETESSSEFKVLYVPKITKKLEDVNLDEGETISLNIEANGVPVPDVQWYKDGQKLSAQANANIKITRDKTRQESYSMTLDLCKYQDTGEYECRVSNEQGTTSTKCKVVVNALDSTGKRPIGDQYQDFKKVKTSGVPLPLPNAPIISRMTDRRLTLSWRPSIPIGPRTPVTYQVEMCELPDGEWTTVRTGIRSCACDVHNLEPFRNYKFRIRVENKYGISDPSPYAVTHREKLEPPPPRFFPYLEPGIDFRPETSPYFPKDFDIERPPHDGYAQAPRFLRQEHDTQYGVKNHNCNLFWFVYGYPKPVMKYYFNDELIESGGRFDQSYTRNGQATLFINKMLERDVGVYEAVATNEHGEARQRVRLEIAEYPVFIKRPEETTMMLRKGTRLEARVIGVPYPDIKWFKDWMPIFSSERVKVSFVEPDTCHLHISDAINKDEGLYSITASNVAGSVSTSVMVHVEEDERRYWDQTYMRPKPVRAHKEVPLAEAYDLGDELGRGTQGVTYHAVERST